MSRTTRSIPNWVSNYSHSDPYTRRGRNEPWIARHQRGQDGVNRGSCGMPSSDSPKGFEGWDEITGNKTWAKRGASKANRRNGKKEINSQVGD